MLSRVANAIYWLNRYVERAENVARFISANYNMTLDIPEGAGNQWQPLINTTGDHELYEELYGEVTRDNAIRFLTFDRRYSNSIYSCVRSARENARSIRDYISSEMWEQLNTFYLMINAASEETVMDLPHQFSADVVHASQAFSGITDATMNHGEGWHFGRLGRMLERADKTTRLLDVKYYILLPSVDYVGSPYDNILWAALLRSASAFEMYRKQYGRITPRNIIDFLMLNRNFPRAVHYSLAMAMKSLNEISGGHADSYTNKAQQVLGRLLAEFQYASLQEIFDYGLHEYLDVTQTRINQVGDAIYDVFFQLKLEE